MPTHDARAPRPTGEQLRHAYAVGTRATIVALVVSASLAVLKIAAGILGDSFALIADGVESVLDIFDRYSSEAACS